MLWLFLLLAAPAPVNPRPDPSRPVTWDDRYNPRTDTPDRPDGALCEEIQIDGGITWLRMTWRWEQGEPVNPMNGCWGSGLLRIVDSGGAPIGFVRTTLGEDEETKTERWRWLAGKSWPSSFKVRPMRFGFTAESDDSTTWEEKVDEVLAAVDGPALVRSQHWNRAFPLSATFVWRGFADTAVTLPQQAGDLWYIGTPSVNSDGPTLYLQARKDEAGVVQPVAWYASGSDDVHLSTEDAHVSFRLAQVSELPASAWPAQ